MLKLVRVSRNYLILGLVFGVYYRELTKFKGFTGETMLGVAHTHTLVLGMLFFLLVALFEKNIGLTSHDKFKWFFGIYNGGLLLTLLMMVIHGTMTVFGMTGNAAISGIAGIGHILLAVGLFLFFYILLDNVKKSENFA